MTQNQLAFPDIDLLIDFLAKTPSYTNPMVRDIAMKSTRWNLSPKQIEVLKKAWESIKQFGGKDPYTVNLSKFPDLEKLADYFKTKVVWQTNDDMISSILNQSRNKILSDKQLAVLQNKWDSVNSKKLSFTPDQISGLVKAIIPVVRSLSRAPNGYTQNVAAEVEDILDRIKQSSYSEGDDKKLKMIVHKYRRLIFSHLF